MWFKNNLQNGKCSQHKIKEESVKFFGKHIESTNKKTVFNKLTVYKNHKNFVTLVQRIYNIKTMDKEFTMTSHQITSSLIKH